MVAFAIGVVFGLAFGLLLMGILSVAAWLPSPSRRRTAPGAVASVRQIA